MTPIGVEFLDRSIAIGLMSFVVTASLLTIPAFANHHGASAGHRSMDRAQMENRIAERFSAADTDGSGTISREEAVARRAARQTERQARRFGRMDSDGNGEISLAERDAAHAARNERQRNHRGAHRGAMIAEESNMRARLTAEEMSELPEGAIQTPPPSQSRRAMRAERRNQAWTAADADENGALNADEFNAMHAARSERRQARRNGRPSRFDRVDTDNDGQLSLAEISVRPLAMFERADADNDGMVTRAERRAARRAMRAERRMHR